MLSHISQWPNSELWITEWWDTFKLCELGGPNDQMKWMGLNYSVQVHHSPFIPLYPKDLKLPYINPHTLPPEYQCKSHLQVPTVGFAGAKSQ